ncbi:hypothetical protein AYI69_g5705 [Smittium culicis]|uniref:Uncharacterized protein n=1 Tax=Smittium culicis TaxID=133412 RepID=A0A1R1Y4E1_9FUNG|nr:hypothetical protein AYI69_g5705 [Smittium culicis]
MNIRTFIIFSTYSIIALGGRDDTSSSENCAKKYCPADRYDVNCIARCYGVPSPSEDMIKNTQRCYTECRKLGANNPFIQGCLIKCNETEYNPSFPENYKGNTVACTKENGKYPAHCDPAIMTKDNNGKNFEDFGQRKNFNERENSDLNKSPKNSSKENNKKLISGSEVVKGQENSGSKVNYSNLVSLIAACGISAISINNII